MGHSLGTRLINNTLPYIKNDNILLTISMAGATPITSYTENIMKMAYGSKMGHLNIYSEHDKVLNTIYPLVESVTPIGVREVRFRPARIINWKWNVCLLYTSIVCYLHTSPHLWKRRNVAS